MYAVDMDCTSDGKTICDESRPLDTGSMARKFNKFSDCIGV